MTAQPDINHLLLRLTSIEKKIEETQRLCEKRHQQTCIGHPNISVRENTGGFQPTREVKTKNTDFREKIMELAQKLTDEATKYKKKIGEVAQIMTLEEKRYKELEMNHVVQYLLKMNQELETKYNEMVHSNVYVLHVPDPHIQKENVKNKNVMQNCIEKLFTYAKNGNEAGMISLLASGTDVNVVDDTGKTPLHYAANIGHTALCYHLVNNGANVNAGEKTVTPLHLARSEGHVSTAGVLAAYGALDLCKSDVFTDD